jgi:putative Ca2+/H+ antiporter (TMEM165/GDT1 family)
LALLDFLLVFGIIFVAEIPDKTFVAMVLMASRKDWRRVATGASVAFVVHSAIAVGIGLLAAKLPSEVLRYGTASVFALAGLYLIIVPEKEEEHLGEGLAKKRFAALQEPLSLAFVTIFIGEWGDLTQVLTLNFTAAHRNPFAVFAGASAGLVAISYLGCFAGDRLSRIAHPAILRKVAGVAMLGLSAASFANVL